MEHDILPNMSTNGTRGTEGTDPSTPSHRLNVDAKLDAVMDALATSNRIGRANSATLWRLENTVMAAAIVALALYLKGRE